GQGGQAAFGAVLLRRPFDWAKCMTFECREDPKCHTVPRGRDVAHATRFQRDAPAAPTPGSRLRAPDQSRGLMHERGPCRDNVVAQTKLRGSERRSLEEALDR